MRRTLGGDRLGSGKKMEVDMHHYNRSTHDLGYIWRSTMAPGTLVPFLVEVALPGDTFDIDLDCSVLTHPTIGPLFGSYKVQLDLFLAPVRLYQGQLHNNKLNIGMNMANIKLPQVRVSADDIVGTKPFDNQQINPSCILSYLNIRGIGRGGEAGTVYRDFNAVPFIAYWDIYKNYYANKQEEIGAVIHNQRVAVVTTITKIEIIPSLNSSSRVLLAKQPATGTVIVPTQASAVIITFSGATPKPEQVMVDIETVGEVNLTMLWREFNTQTATEVWGTGNKSPYALKSWRYIDATDVTDNEVAVATFPLSNIDDMREDILMSQSGTFQIDANTYEPYGWPLQKVNNLWNKLTSLEGLAVKTYQSDLLNNWLSTEWIDGDNGVNAITAVDTTDGSFTIDQLQLAKKVYDMLNRIAVSGGSYNDWQDAVWSHNRHRQVENPMYMGGLSKELIFQEVVSNAASAAEGLGQPLGTLAGRGVLGKKHKGGSATIRVDEPSYVMGIVSLTPRLDYSQGNKWDVNLKTMDDFHKPALDEIGYQDLNTDQMAFWDTEISVGGVPQFFSAGKQPAWLNYMTNVNVVRGNFAIEESEMFMVLTRRYEVDPADYNIKDITTYIDPMKFNHIFAETARDAQNFWVQIGVDITARRLMSARLMPNL